MFNLLIQLLKNTFFLTGSYSNTVFLDPLTFEEEQDAVNKMLKGNKAARNLLIEHNLRLVAHIVKKFENSSVDQDDLIGIGTIGLIKGIDSYSNERNVKVGTYVSRCIENEILMFFRTSKKHKNNVSLDDTIGYDKDGNAICLIDVIEDNDNALEDKVFLNENIDLLNKYIDKLNKREKEIIIKRYGLNNTKEMTQKDIANELKISRSYVSRIEKRALTKILRAFIKEKKV